ncbi:MAG: DUF2953 domain-containing protein, partial [Firmicutes bacterium]|nr:DUF2953 domain-containing protein [Bacillota bacterium]
MPVSFFFFALLFLLIGYFLPVVFHVRFTYEPPRCELRLEIRFLHGLIKGIRIYRRPEPGTPENPRPRRFEDVLTWIRGLPSRLSRYGFGGTLLASFIPPRYLPWLRVAEDLDRDGRLLKFRWQTVVGTDDAAGTALTVGALWALKGGFLAFLRRRYRLPPMAAAAPVKPSFLQARLFTQVECIFAFRW